MNNSTNIYFLRADLAAVDTSQIFEISEENGKLRVKNDHINCLYSNLSPKSFDQIYNDFNRHLNLDFEPLNLNDKIYQLKPKDQEKLSQTIITNLIYFYTINNLPVQVKSTDFTHPNMIDYVLDILDKKYKKEVAVGLALGAKILRQNLNDYTKSVQGRRMYYER